MRLYGPSATSGAISTPRLIGPGCMISTPSFAFFNRSTVRPKRRLYSRSDGSRVGPCRSRWIRSIMMMSASAMAAPISQVARTPSCSGKRGRSVDGPATLTSIPILRMAAMLDRATRLWPVSPTIAPRPGPAHPPQPLADGEQVEERLGGMLVGPVPGIDDRGPQAIGQDLGGPRSRMADHHHIRVHGLKGLAGVEEGFALGDGGGGRRDVDYIGAQPLAGDLERGPRPRARLVEEVDHGLAPKGGDLLNLSGGDLFHRVGRVQDELDLLRLELADRQQILSLQRHCSSRCPPINRCFPE